MFRRQLIVGASVLSLVACQGPSMPENEGEKKMGTEELAATVDGEPITIAEYEVAVERNLSRYRGQAHQLPPGIEQRIKESVLRRLIDEKVVAKKAEAIGVVVTSEEVQVKFDEHKKRFRTEQAFADYLKRSNNSEVNMKSDLSRNMLRDRVVEKMSGSIELESNEARKYYDAHAKRFVEKEQVRASRILIRFGMKATDAEKKAAKKKAAEIRNKIIKGAANFAEVAKAESNGPEAGRGGDLNWLSRGRMSPEFDAVAFQLKPGSVSSVVMTKSGFEIIKVWEKKPERQRPFEEVKASIGNSLMARKRNEKRREVLRELKGSTKVKQLIKFERPQAKTNGKSKVASPGRALELQKKLKLQHPPKTPAPESKN